MKNLLCGAALLACLAPAMAAEQTFKWRFSVFVDLNTYEPISDVLSGQFTVNDLNGDGKYERAEVSSMVYQDFDFASCGTCLFTDFSWTPGASLSFDIERSERRAEGWWTQRVAAPYLFYEVLWADNGGVSSTGGRWYDLSRATVTPVPEPQTWLMLGAGLLALAGAARGRSSNHE